MRSRVQKNQELYQTLAADLDSNEMSADLSKFANKLNEIDDQFKKVEEPSTLTDEPTRARFYETTQKPEQESQEENTFDTFENAYLKDFLAEVKEYNVKKNYRDIGDTQQNILKELSRDGSIPKPLDEDTMVHVLQELNIGTEEESADSHSNQDEDELEKTRLFTVQKPSEEFLDVEEMKETIIKHEEVELEEVKHEEQAIAKAVQELSEEPIVQQEIEPHESSDVGMDFVTEEIGPFHYDAELFKQELIEQTQTLQHKVIDQERSIEKIDKAMIRTNRLINVVISLLLIAVFAMVAIIISIGL